MRTAVAVAAGLILAFGATFALTAFALPEPATVEKPLEVTSPPARP